MAEQAAAGWYKQPDGSQRYWDGSQWTEHTSPAASENASTPDEGDSRPLWKKKRFIFPAVAVALFFALILFILFIGALVSATDDDDVSASPSPEPSATSLDASPSSTPSESPEPTLVAMPDLLGDDLQDAQDELQSEGLFLLDQEDASGQDRMQIVDSNWQVCEQEPSAGTMVSADTVVVLYSVKDDEFCPGDEPEEPEAPEEPSMTVAQEQAVRSANNYLDYTAFSRSGLIGQLEYEGFSSQDAEFAVDYIVVDWKEQAALKAQQYLDYSAFSRQGLIDQLEYEGFTRSQAEYGADEVGL